jgi:hypothetical protein
MYHTTGNGDDFWFSIAKITLDSFVGCRTGCRAGCRGFEMQATLYLFDVCKMCIDTW